MTRPSEIKPREDSTPGTPFAKFTIGKELGETRFSITPEIVEEYFRAVDAERSLYVIDGRQAAAPNVSTLRRLIVCSTCGLDIPSSMRSRRATSLSAREVMSPPWL